MFPKDQALLQERNKYEKDGKQKIANAAMNKKIKMVNIIKYNIVLKMKYLFYMIIMNLFVLLVVVLMLL